MGRGSAGVHRHRKPHPNLARALASRLCLQVAFQWGASYAGELKTQTGETAAASTAYAALFSSIACAASIKPVLAASRKSTSRTCMGSSPGPADAAPNHFLQPETSSSRFLERKRSSVGDALRLCTV